MDLITAARQEFAPALASALLHSLWQGVLIAAAAALTLNALTRASAAWRHIVGMAFLAVMTLAPLLQLVRFTQDAAVRSDEGFAAWLVPGAVSDLLAEVLRDSAFLAPGLTLAWASGAAIMLSRHIRSLGAVSALEAQPAQALPPVWQRRVEELRMALGVARPVSLRVTDRVSAPCTARLLRPIVWLPLSLVTRAPAQQLEALLAHELAHIARKDWLWNGLQCVLESLLFFHPAAWWLGRRIRQEREHACDDLAVSVGGDAVALAEALADLERRRSLAPRLLVAASGGSLLQRIRRLVVDQPARSRWTALAAVGALAMGSVLLLTEIGMAGGRLPDLRVTASTTGELGPGDFREILAEDGGLRRHYREDVDAAGRRSEIYREDGRPRTIDAEVRRWIAEVSTPLVPQVTPVAPSPPGVAGIPEYGALIDRVVVHPQVVARLGSPVAPATDLLDGSLRLHETGGEAEVRIALTGPRGAATANVSADLVGGVWIIRRLRLP